MDTQYNDNSGHLASGITQDNHSQGLAATSQGAGTTAELIAKLRARDFHGFLNSNEREFAAYCIEAVMRCGFEGLPDGIAYPPFNVASAV